MWVYFSLYIAPKDVSNLWKCVRQVIWEIDQQLNLHRPSELPKTIEFLLNGAEPSLNSLKSVNSGNMINHWSMYCGNLKILSVTHVLIIKWLKCSLVKWEVTRSNPFDWFLIILVTEFFNGLIGNHVGISQIILPSKLSVLGNRKTLDCLVST